MPNHLKPKKLIVGVLMGGPSAEHEVSLATGKNVMDNLDKTKYRPIAIKLSKNKNQWFLNGRLSNIIQALKSCDIVFNALHGTFGEDGRVQALMEYYGTRYTGSGITASALAMDKLRSREIFKLAGFCVPKTLKIKKNENYKARLNLFITKITKFPVVVKPCSNGSSVGVQIVRNNNALLKAIDEAFKLEKKVLVEEFIKGREVTCGVLDPALQRPDASSKKDCSLSDEAGNFLTLTIGGVTALPVTEIIPVKGHKFFDYDAKYKTGHCWEVTPAQIDETTREKVQKIAVRAHQLLGCRGYSRTDMILKNDSIYLLETNTLPGLTKNSLIPQAAKAAGLTFSQLLDKIIDSSLVNFN
ncbi:MAG: hypothetical protein A3J46_01200 [Candidatus Yanofskybacteria bacterium RIFCSPHIGHO2_02_FULL_41_11]|uniref:D-alanine--D-alanine ligase n=1 Tax=Candidatus Yanofskybacteria bacterium RIFCSPHIGHO2_02_FULL_41_11 TaxID=1802675 RepID=A0A1F8F8C8_9BACT|nr:MAG: hypothetical protein A3J46_01200 [Candidatus Yanofskybacteria bacterium RIFCSPHIGHO2_02_FULL_41_11]